MSEFDQYAKSYASAVNDSIAFSGLKVDTFVTAKARHLRRLFAEHAIGPSDIVADVGCGVGTYEEQLLATWPAMHGIDVSLESINEARERCPAGKFDVFDGETMPFESGSVAAAFAICVWHHVPVALWPRFVSEVRRILRPGGIFAVFEHNPWNPLTRWAVERCVFDKDAVLLSMPTAKRFLTQGGFKVAASEFILSLPAAEGRLASVDRALRKVPTGAQYLVVGQKP